MKIERGDSILSKKTKVFTVALAVVLFVVSLNIIGLAENGGTEEKKAEYYDNLKRVEEMEDMRTLDSKTYLMEDGSYQYSVRADVIHYAAGNGKLEILKIPL